VAGKRTQSERSCGCLQPPSFATCAVSSFCLPHSRADGERQCPSGPVPPLARPASCHFSHCASFSVCDSYPFHSLRACATQATARPSLCRTQQKNACGRAISAAGGFANFEPARTQPIHTPVSCASYHTHRPCLGYAHPAVPCTTVPLCPDPSVLSAGFFFQFPSVRSGRRVEQHGRVQPSAVLERKICTVSWMRNSEQQLRAGNRRVWPLLLQCLASPPTSSRRSWVHV